MAYPFDEIEQRWQAHWREHETFRTPGPGDPGFDPDKPKAYVLDMFPYPSGAGLHVGHPEGYTATDIVARAKRMQGFNVLHPMGWDAFGLPAEQAAIKEGIPPRVTTERNVETFRGQLQRLGFSYDWAREINTTDPRYVKWTQWIFLKLYERGLAYEAFAPVNFCPELGAVLSNEEVIDGKSEIGGHPVVQLPMRQWMLRITEYAERLLDGLDGLDWPESVKAMQRNWIGKSVGAEVDFRVMGHAESPLRVFTTRPDTLFGATYMVLAPEHPLVASITTKAQKEEVEAYVAATARKTERDRMEEKEKTGVFTGAHAVNPATGFHIPIWTADYVLSTYGTGAIMAVPAHDARDFAFANAFGLPIREVVAGGDLDGDGQLTAPYTGDGTLVNSDASERNIGDIADRGVSLDGLSVPDAKAAMLEWLESNGVGRRQTNYKLRDWLFSRQRYWGEPIPVIHVDGVPQPLPPDVLPLTLPEVESYKPAATGESPLASADAWLQTTDPATGQPALRETNTMPQWAGSCWYYLRFIDPDNADAPWDPEKERYWMPVDLYIGGAEHAVLHLLYARFWHKVLFDAGLVSTDEPFQKLVNQGMILGEDHQKMSKSRGNVVNPDDVIAEYGADALRLYEMFMGPLEQVKPWNTRSVEGVYRFLGRAWRLVTELPVTDEPPAKEHLRALHEAIGRVTEDIEALRFNTAIAALMEFVNAATKWNGAPRAVLQDFVLLLAPFAPHLAEELWQRLGHSESLAYAPWPALDESHLVQDEVGIAVQVNGKLRATITVRAGTDKPALLAAAKADEAIQRYLAEGTVRREIVVPGRLVNFVVS